MSSHNTHASTSASPYARPISQPLSYAFMGLFVLTLSFVSYKAFAPVPPLIEVTHFDKVLHFLSFGCLTVLLGLAKPRAPLYVIALILTGYGGLIETFQALPPGHRTPSLLDLLANISGIAMAICGWIILVKTFRLFTK